MNDSSRDGRRRAGVVNTGALLAACSGAVILALAGGCRSPFHTYEDEYGPTVPVERLSTVRSAALERYVVPEDAAGIERVDRIQRALTDGAAEELPPAPEPFEGLGRVPLTIEEVRRRALENNLELRADLVDPVIAATRVTEEEAAYEAVFRVDARFNNLDQPTASRLTGAQVERLDLTPSVTIPSRTGGEVTFALPINREETNNEFATLNPSYESDFSVSLSQNLLRGAGRRANTHAIRVAAIGARVTGAQTKLSLIRQLAEADRAYWRLVAARRLLDVAVSQYELAAEQLESARRRVDAGDAPEVEVVRARAGVAERLGSIITAQNTVRVEQRRLKRIMNAEGLDVGSSSVLVPETELDPVRLVLDGPALADAAVAQRMEMLELELRLAQDLSTIDFERNRALPLFVVDYRYNINGLGGTVNDSFGTLRDNRFEDWSVGATFETPLGNEAAESRVHRAVLTRLQRLATRAAREQSIREEVLNAVDALDASWLRILAARQNVILAARTLEAERNQFRVGARTSTEVLDAATALANAQAEEIRALTDYQIAQVDLAFATGTLLGAAKVVFEPVDPRPAGTAFGDKGGFRGRAGKPSAMGGPIGEVPPAPSERAGEGVDGPGEPG